MTSSAKQTKFSVLLPTRDRLEYLRYAVESVLRQDYQEWEIVISDNFSKEDLAGYVRSLEDARIRYFRTDSAVPVTENWNNALSLSTGDQVIMLGDDDCLVPGYFQNMAKVIGKFDNPDLIYHKAYLFAYPGVMPKHPRGYLQPFETAEFLDGHTEPFLLTKAHAKRAVEQSMKFRQAFGFNMQLALLSRELIDTLTKDSPLFRSPFPDFYAMNVAFLESERILALPERMVIIGISPRSYGFFHFNRRDSEGMEFLGAAPDPDAESALSEVLLPGTNINDGWLFAMEAIRAKYGAKYGVAPDHSRYRFAQFSSTLEAFLRRKASWAPVAHLLRRLSKREIISFIPRSIALMFLRLLDRVLHVPGLHAAILKLGQVRSVDPPRIEGRYKNAIDAFESLR